MENIDTLKKAAVAVGQIATKVGSILDDGKVGIRDLPDLISLAAPAEQLLALSAKDGLDELWDLEQAEVEELVALFKKSFDLADDVVELAAEEGVELALRWAELVKDTVIFGKRIAPVEAL